MPDKINEQKPEDTKIVKDKNDKTGNFIFQNTKITKAGLVIIVIFLIILVLGVVFSGVWLGN
ncbi:hypothetical protein [Flavimarina sp. Hel_I_48]|uniref:hypothetical protein n=1 Tax=Flavimarina sp. Hel_I_48 TaxID=1392488 RepID=UPI0004DF88B1|nr:hypothetical protein [Flavimarina sp. Hel_I_48]